MILVTGGTGLVGAHLLYFLISKGEKVRAIRRAHSNTENVLKVFSLFTKDAPSLFAQIEWVEADIMEIPSLEKAFHKIKYVYHAAAYISLNNSDCQSLRKINIEGTANIVNMCLEKDIEKLCHVSSIAVFGKTVNNSIVTEETPWNPDVKNNCYAISKYGAEMEVWRASQEGLKVVIVNPGVILGANFSEGSTVNLSRLFNKKLKYYTEGITGFVDVEDVVSIMIKLMESPIYGENYILVSDNYSFKKFFESIANTRQITRPKIKISRMALDIFWILETLKTIVTSKKRILPKAVIEALTTARSYSNTKIKNELNFEFKPLEQTIKTICESVKT